MKDVQHLMLAGLMCFFLIMTKSFSQPDKTDVKLKLKVNGKQNVDANLDSLRFSYKQRKKWKKKDQSWLYRKYHLRDVPEYDHDGVYDIKMKPGTWRVKFSGEFISQPYHCKKTFQVSSEKHKQTVVVPCEKKRPIKCRLKLIEKKHNTPIKDKTLYTKQNVGVVYVQKNGKEIVDTTDTIKTDDQGVIRFYVWDDQNTVRFRFDSSDLFQKENVKKEFQVKKLEVGNNNVATWSVAKKKRMALLDLRFKTPDGVKSYSKQIKTKYFPKLRENFRTRFYVLDPDALRKGKQLFHVVKDDGVFDSNQSKYFFYKLEKGNEYIISPWIEVIGTNYFLFPKYENRRFMLSDVPYNLGMAVVDVTEDIKRLDDRPPLKTRSDESEGVSHPVTITLSQSGKELSEEVEKLLFNHPKKITIYNQAQQDVVKRTSLHEQSTWKTDLKNGRYKVQVTSHYFHKQEKRVKVNGERKVHVTLEAKPITLLSVQNEDGTPTKRGVIKLYDEKKKEPVMDSSLKEGLGVLPTPSEGKYLLHVMGVKKNGNVMGHVFNEIDLTGARKRIDVTISSYRKMRIKLRPVDQNQVDLNGRFAIKPFTIWGKSVVPVQSSHRIRKIDRKKMMFLPENTTIRFLLRTIDLNDSTEVEKKFLKLDGQSEHRTLFDLGTIKTDSGTEYTLKKFKRVQDIDELIQSTN